MKHLKRNLILIFIADTLLLIACLAFTVQKFIHHPQMSLELIILLIFYEVSSRKREKKN